MQFPSFKEFKQVDDSIEKILDYLRKDLNNNWKDLRAGLQKKLNFDDNVDSFLSDEITLASGAEGKLRHGFEQVPGEWIVVRLTGPYPVESPTDAFDSKYAYFKNTGSASTTFTVRFFK